MVGYADLSRAYADISRKLENTLRIGKICEADYGKARLRVELGEVTTGWLPWITTRAGNDISWWAPELGEQVMVLSPGGDLAQGVVLPAIYQTASPACADRPTIDRITYEDGAIIEYDKAAHRLYGKIPGSALLECKYDIEAIAGHDIFANSLEGDIDVVADQGQITLRTVSDNINIIAERGNINMTATEGKISCRAKGEVGLFSEEAIRQSAPKLISDGVIENGTGQYGGGGKINGPIEQTNGDFVSDGVSLQHHKHKENGDVTDEPVGGNDGN
ncbi:phage baseplate assembly protein V [Maridesulfovibrio sp.]|uniref:phage baseplate assembly protein V n=1 Tax=Maridesulfovibrio sp. TaxID=2795000 RepID=UPI0029CA525E|nr:phage baseplate assembly protein V [Maridesulfovibrio sp.]